MDLHSGKMEFKFGRSEDNNSENEFYAFVDSIETLENGDTIILFDSIEISQIQNVLESRPSSAFFEGLRPRMIKGDFTSNEFQSFKKTLKLENEELSESTWLILKLSQNPTQFKVEYIEEYFEGEPESISTYLDEGCKKANPETQEKLDTLFEIEESDDDCLKMVRKKKLKYLFDKEPLRDNSNFDVVVYDVGQGNMIAILDEKGEPVAYFDVGGGCYWNARTYKSPNPRRLCFTNDPYFILSHWDSDHWWTFNKLLRDKNKKRNQIPKTTWIIPLQKLGPNQYKFYNLLKLNGHKIYVWSSRINCYFIFGQIVQCTGDPKEKNDSGLALKTTIGNERILLPGDASYKYIPKVEEEKHTCLVASHHGGLVSNNLTEYPEPDLENGKIVYSFGLKNKYHHPNGLSVIQHYQADWKNIKMTPDGSVSFLSNTLNNAICGGNSDLDIDQIF